MKSYNLGSNLMQEISESAAFYAEEYCSQSEVIQPHVIAKALKLTYSASNYKNAFDGLLEYRNQKFHVYLNTGDDGHLYSSRVRFSFAHELGHYIIDHHRNTLMRPDVKPHGSLILSSDLKIEREADLFAACLLMPEKRIKADIFRKKFNFVLIDLISKKYQVSITAAILRFIALGNHPVMLVCSRNNKVVWRRFTDDFPFYTILPTPGDTVPVNTAAGEYFQGHRKYTQTQTVFAEDWFLLNQSRDRGRKFSEHCIYYEPLKQVISVLWEG